MTSSLSLFPQAMLALIKRYQEEDRALQVKKAEDARRLKLDILAANERAALARREAREREKEVGG